MDLSGLLAARGGESFEVNDEESGGSGKDDLLRGFPFFAAIGAFPDFFTTEHFLLAVAAEALVNVTGASSGDFYADAVKGFVGGRCTLTGRAA